MSFHRSWIFSIGLLFCHLPIVLSTVDDHATRPSSLKAVQPRAVHVQRSQMLVPIIVGSVGGVALIALGIFAYFRVKHLKRKADLEDGIPATPQMSGRAWFSRANRSGKDYKSATNEKTPLSAKTPGDIADEPLSAVPRYLKAQVPLSPKDRPLPPSPAYPRSPRARPKGKENNLTLTVPSTSPTGRSPTGLSRSPSFRKKTQVAPEPVVLSKSPYGELPNSGRKRTLLPNVFKQRPADRNPRLAPGYEHQLHADYAQRQNPRSAPNSAISPYPYTPRSGSDISIEDDIADLPVKTPRIQVTRSKDAF